MAAHLRWATTGILETVPVPMIPGFSRLHASSGFHRSVDGGRSGWHTGGTEFSHQGEWKFEGVSQVERQQAFPGTYGRTKGPLRRNEISLAWNFYPLA